VSEHGVLPGLWPIHGDGVLARQGDLVLLIHPAGGTFTDRLLDLLNDCARAGDDGLGYTDRVSAEFDTDASAADPATEHGPAVVAFGPVAGGTAVAVYGTGWADITTAYGAQRLTAGEPYGRMRCVLPSALIKIRAGVQPVAGDGETDPYLRLADGVVRAVALLYAPAEVQTEPRPGRARPAAPAPSAAPDVSPAAPYSGQVAPDESLAVSPDAPVLAEEPPPAEAGEPAYMPAAAEVPAYVPAEPAESAYVPAEPAVPAYVPAAAEVPAYLPVEPEPVLDQVQQAAPEPYPDHIRESEPEYHPTRIEPAVPTPSAPPAAEPDPFVAAPWPGPSGAQAPPHDPYAPPHDPYGAQPPLDPYAGQAPPPGPGPAVMPPDGGQPQDFISISLLADQAGQVPQRDPLPLGAEPPEAKDLGLVEMPSASVEGVYCKNGHFNDPEARYCAVCGISMGQLTKIRQKGTRPPLGVLVLSDGSVCQLDADYVIGREPTLDNAVADGRARPLRLMGASGVVSRIHARVELDGWQVFLTDLNSANGTQVLMPGAQAPISLQPGIRTPLQAGTQIRLGGEYGLQYDSHRHR
jgi:hypothetical protein